MRTRSLAAVALATGLFASAPAYAIPHASAARGSEQRSPFRFDPEVSFEVQTGMNAFTGGLGIATHVGPSWQARAGLRPFPWLSFGAVYTAGYNAGRREIVGPGIGLLSNGGYVSVSLIAPLRGPVHPYAGVGIGYGWDTVVGSRSSNTPLHDTAGAFVPVGFGLDVSLGSHLSVGPQFVYQRTVGGGSDSGGASGGVDYNEGDSWNLGVSLGYAL